MHSNRKKIDDLLNDIEIKCDPAIGSRACTQFSLDCLALIHDKLPPVAERGIELVAAYLAGQIPLEPVNDARLKCWQYLDEKHKHAPMSSPEVSAIRAVIFPLDAQRNPHELKIVDHLSLFLEFVNCRTALRGGRVPIAAPLCRLH